MKLVRRTPAKLVFIGIMIFTALGGLFLFDTLRKQAAAEAVQSNADVTVVPVVVHPIDTKALQQTIEAVGTVVADQQVIVASEVAGRITQIHFENGTTVKAGAPLLQINDASQRKELDRYRATAQLAHLNLERAKRLHGQSMSRADYEQHVTAHAESQALVAQTEAEIALRLVHAPFAGELGIRQVNLGQYVEAGTHIATLTDLDTLHVDFTVPERYRYLLTPGLEVSLVGDTANQPTVKGKITSIDPQVDATQRAVPVRATLNAEGRGHWWPGAFARVRVQMPEGETMLHVPTIAINSSLSGQSVFVIRKSSSHSVARLIPIQTGDSHGDSVAVKAGELNSGDLVVVAGQVNLQDNTPVTLRMQSQDSETLPSSTLVEGEE